MSEKIGDWTEDELVSFLLDSKFLTQSDLILHLKEQHDKVIS